VEVSTRSFETRSPPTFATVAEARRHGLERLAAACRIFGRRGYADGLLGHLTWRDPEFPDRFWVNPVGVALARVRASQFLQVDKAGRILHGRGAVNPVGFLLHSALHEARPDVNAVCHAHSLHGTAWCSLERPLDPITQDACVFHGRQALIREPRKVADPAAAARFAAAFGTSAVALHAGHGLFTTGTTIDEAAWWFVQLDQCCHVQLLAEAAGTPTRWSDDDARWLAATLGAPKFGWLSFQTLWDEIIASDPDLVD
jgi:ribulose-5-phosphate 4-epimerase/fuculose-1-phosphate aldolase